MITPVTPLDLPLTSPRAAVTRWGHRVAGKPAAVLTALVLLAAGAAPATASVDPADTLQLQAFADTEDRFSADRATLGEDGTETSSGLNALADVSTRLEARMAQWARAHLGQMPDMAGYGLLLAGLGVMDALTRKRRQHGG